MAWFIIDYFTHSIDFISQARKNFGLQISADDTVLAEQSDYVWDPEWSHPLFLNMTIDISSQASSTTSINKDYIKVSPLTTDATPLNYNSILPDRTGNNSLNSTLIQHENLIGTRNLTKQDIQTPSHFANEEEVTTAITTTQQNISPIHPNLTTPIPKNPPLPQVTLQATVKPTVVPKYPHVNYQPFRPMTKPIKKQRSFMGNNFAEHNDNYVNRPQTSKPSRPNTQNHLFSQRKNFQQPTTISVNFHDYPQFSQDQSENYQFFQHNKNNKQHKTPYYTLSYLSTDDDDYYQPDIFAPNTQEYRVQQPRPNQAFIISH